MLISITPLRRNDNHGERSVAPIQVHQEHCRRAKSFVLTLMRIILKSFLLAVAALPSLIFSPVGSQAAETLPDGFYRYPTIGGGSIIFAAEGDLCKVHLGAGGALLP